MTCLDFEPTTKVTYSTPHPEHHQSTTVPSKTITEYQSSFETSLEYAIRKNFIFAFAKWFRADFGRSRLSRAKKGAIRSRILDSRDPESSNYLPL
jgi:hypothetical protein